MYVVTQPCIGTKDTACVDVCPSDAIHPRKDEPAFASEKMLYIDPEACVDCGACEPACPVQAIYPDHNIPPEWAHYREINVNWYRQPR